MKISMKITKNVKTLLLALILLVSYGTSNILIADHHENGENHSNKMGKSTKMGSKTMVIAIVNEASWCPACQENGKRIKSDVVSKFMNNMKVKIVVNNLSDKKTTEESNKKLMDLGINNFTENNKTTGVIYFVNPKTKKVIDKISVTESNQKIIYAFDKYMVKM